MFVTFSAKLDTVIFLCVCDSYFVCYASVPVFRQRQLAECQFPDLLPVCWSFFLAKLPCVSVRVTMYESERGGGGWEGIY